MAKKGKRLLRRTGVMKKLGSKPKIVAPSSHRQSRNQRYY